MTVPETQLINYRTKALFQLNAEGRLLQVNEPKTKQITPRLYITRTRDKVVCHIWHDVPETIKAQLEALIVGEPSSDEFSAPLRYHQVYIDLLAALAPVRSVVSGPAYILPKMSSLPQVSLIIRERLQVLETHFPVTAEMFDFRQPVCAVLDDDVAVSVCFCARKTDVVAEAGLFTAETHRKRGYALAVVSRWAYELQEMGIQPLYSTSWDNTASQAVASKLGALMFASDFSFR